MSSLREKIKMSQEERLQFLEKQIGVNIDIITTSPEREDTIVKRNPFDEI